MAMNGDESQCVTGIVVQESEFKVVRAEKGRRAIGNLAVWQHTWGAPSPAEQSGRSWRRRKVR